MVDRILRRLLGCGRLRWRGGTVLAEGAGMTIRAFRDPATRKLRPTGLPPGAALIKGLGYWCVDPKAGTVCPVELQVVEVPKPKAAVPPSAAKAAPTKAVLSKTVPLKATARPAAARPAPERPDFPAASAFPPGMPAGGRTGADPAPTLSERAPRGAAR
ncbi:ATP-dependent helicase, partial [Azospirillum brasilense]|nr:ATP-dependent helicase [Azospirillum brasilense]